MANAINRDLETPAQAERQLGEGLQIDYSYNQWRHAQMQQLERNYEAQCERGFQA